MHSGASSNKRKRNYVDVNEDSDDEPLVRKRVASGELPFIPFTLVVRANIFGKQLLPLHYRIDLKAPLLCKIKTH